MCSSDHLCRDEQPAVAISSQHDASREEDAASVYGYTDALPGCGEECVVRSSDRQE